MDPICHTLVGGALGMTGLARRTRWSRATLVIGANLPDIDVLAYAWGGTAALGFRRGLTHGLPATLVVLPLVLALAMKGWARWRSGSGGGASAPFGQLWMLAAIAVATHPLLDYLNTYGMRWFMPVIDRWYYGDVLFIVDPWMWAILAAGVVLGWRKRARFGAGGAALVVAGLYVLAMAIGSGMARRVAWERLASEGATRLMVAPAPLNPFRRMVVAEVRGGGAYRFGGVSLWPRPSIEMDDVVVPVEWPGPARLAAATPEGATFLHWARFPFTEIETASDSVTVHFIDARYTLDANASFGAIRIKVPVDHAVAR